MHLMPVVFVPHGGGPMPLLGDANHRELTQFMQSLAADLPRPQAILVVTAHWEEEVVSITSAPAPGMLFDYYGFPPESYEFAYPAPGNPSLAKQIQQLLAANTIDARLDNHRAYDHGTFVPLMLMYPAADIPVVQLSLLASLDPAAHIALGKALAPLREQGVLIVGSGMSFHNMRAFFSNDPSVRGKSETFDQWLSETVTAPQLDNPARELRLREWASAPQGRFCHPREEHLLPLHVCWGAASQHSPVAVQNFSGLLFNTAISGFIWR
ncbi:class III extradiol ring-cleavage dioxygenase [Cellvibrio sp. pealriver]|uniref:DODA-type extradiol aromatic ring-opening family dioxygenase n=1 Tax=Cellvibrio sp. pealriver TaxID=1622269 RepID=UPI000AE9FA8B|nr:class III extradiol ring-cleavage dioxygenase [Cellvibrio sp. pealriver]